MVWLILGCGEQPSPAADPLVIPADNPMWALLDGFLPNQGMYGESSWDDVRMRVVGHVYAIGRDIARARVAREDWAGCAAVYRDTQRLVEGIQAETPTGKPIQAALSKAAARGAALCDAVDQGKPPAGDDPRSRYVGLALRARNGEDVTAEARALGESAPAPRGLSLDGFGGDFEERHALRVQLVEAWAEEADLLGVDDPWGYWDPAVDPFVQVRQDAAMLAMMAGTEVRPVLVDVRRETPLVFTARDLGALPTGDSLIDVVGFPGPRAIGSLAVLSLEDPEHRAWLEARAAELNALPDADVPAAIESMVRYLDAKPYGSRYYNIKQLRDTAVRVLASHGAYREALHVLRASWPLHAQDWACPDRAAILRAIEGRLLLAAGDPVAAEEVLGEAMTEADAFLAKVAAAPSSAPPPGPNGPPGPPPKR